MFSFNLVRWVRSLFRSRGRTIVNKPRYRPLVETLEDRLAPAQFIWTGAAGSAWSQAGNWFGGVAPTSSPSNLADLVFNFRGASSLTANNDLNGLLVNSISISDLNNYNLTGNAITLGDPSASSSGTILVGANLSGGRIGMDMQLAAALNSQQFITINTGSDLTISGHLSGTTGSQLTKQGAGTLVLTNDNSTFVGPFNINPNAGIVRITNSKALGGPLSSSVQTVRLNNPSAGATPTRFTLTFNGATTAPITYTGTQADGAAVRAALNALSSIAPNGFVLVSQTNTATTETFTITLGGNLAGTSQPQITAAITSGPGTQTTNTIIVGGVATSNQVTVGDNSQLQLSGPMTGSIANSLQLFGTGASSNGSLFNVAGNNTWSGPIAMGTDTSINTAAGTTLTVSGVVSDLATPKNLTKIGQGTLVFPRANTYRGTTTVADGTLVIQNPLALGSVPAAGTSVIRNTPVTGMIGTLQIDFNSAVAPTGPDNSGYWTLQDPTLPFNAVSNPYIGFVVKDVPLTLNATGFNGAGALRNSRGNNTWTGTVTLGSPAPIGANVSINVDPDPITSEQTRLFLTGVIQDVVAPNGPFNLTKIGLGDLVLAPTSGGVGTPNLYRGTTTISAGTITLRDSQGLGPQTKRNLAGNSLPIVTVQNGASLNLESNVGHIDSATGTINRLEVAAPISIVGQGFNNLGALHSLSGINTYTESFVTTPTQNPVSGNASGAGLPLGLNYWVVTAIDGFGESLASDERSFNVTAGTRHATISWSLVPGATGYRIYRSTTPGSYGAASRVTTVVGGATTSFVDTGAALTAGTPPAVFPVISLAGDAAIGVDTEPNQTADENYFTNDYSLTINGGISGAATTTLSKVGTGHLILPNANNAFLGDTTISAGWITVQDSNALGGPNPSVQEVQPLVKVDPGAALMLRPFAPGTSFTFTHNLELQGSGIAHPFEEINLHGAVENLSGVNTLTSNILLRGPVGIGVEEVFGQSHLVTTGTISEGVPNLSFNGNPSGGARQSIGPAPGGNPVDTGSTSGLLTISALVHSIGDDIRVYLGNWKDDPANARLIYDASNDFVSVQPTATNQFGADITINYTATSATIDVVDTFDPGPGPAGTGTGWLYEGLGPQAITYAPVAGIYATWVTIVVNPGQTGGGFTQWTYTANIVPSGTNGGIVKLGSQRLDIQGQGTYGGGVNIQEGVVRAQNNTALGAPGNSGTVVQAGAALELGTTVPDQNGGQALGLSIVDTPLTLNGTGNATFGDAPLVVLANDNLWRGPITLNAGIAITFQNALADQPINTMTTTSSLTGTAASVSVVTSTIGGGGINAAQTFTFGGIITGGTFRLTYNDGSGNQTTGNIAYSSNPTTLIANITNALNPIFGAANFGVSLPSPQINIYPNARFVVDGDITDGNAAIVSPLIHDYQLNGSLADALGGPSLVQVGGSLNATNFTWNQVAGANEGLTLTGALPTPSSYAIEMVFNFSGVFPANPPGGASYYRILDLANRTIDNGLYAHSTGGLDVLTAFPGTPGTNQVFATGVNVHLVISRSATGNVTAWIDGVQQLSFNDVAGDYIQTANIIHFFIDDLAIDDEISGGTVDKIRIYSRPLLQSEVTTIFNNGNLGGVAASGYPADLSMSGGGELVLMGNNSYRGTTFVNQGILSLHSGSALGSIGIAGQQELALTSALPGSTTFTLTFPGVGTTSTITYQGNASDASTIQTRLRTLLGTGNVSVHQANPGVFLITYSGTLAGNTTLLTASITSGAGTGTAAISTQGGTYVADKAQLQLSGGITVAGEPLTIQGTGHNVASAVQTFTVGSTTVVPTGNFALSFNGSSTGDLPFNITAGQLQAALQNLPTVENVGGQVLVNVASISPGINEEQRVTFTGFTVGQTYQMYFDPANGPNQLGYNLTAPIVYSGNPFTEKDRIIAAMSTLQTIGGLAIGGTLSGIAAAGPLPGGNEFADFVFTGGLADQDVVMAKIFPGAGPGVGTVTEFTKGKPGSRTFTVEFQGAFAGLPQNNLLVVPPTTPGSTTVTAPTTTIVGGSANATPIQWFAQGPAPGTDAVVFNNAPASATQLTAGRVTGLAVQGSFADDIYIATAGGGFWRTIDAGKRWTPVFDDTSNNSVLFGGTVAIAPSADSNVYFGTGEGNNRSDNYYGSGVYVANTHAELATSATRLLTNPDGSNPLAGKAITKIVVNPNNPLMIWVSASDRVTNGTAGNAGVWRYDGVNWLDMTSAAFASTNIEYMDIAYDSGANVLMASFGNSLTGNSDILRCTDPTSAVPAAFTAANIAGVIGGAAARVGNIKLTVAGGNVAYGAVANAQTGGFLAIVRTANAGASWLVVADIGGPVNNITNYMQNQGFYASAIVASGATVYVGGTDQGNGANFVLRSTNNGAAWTDISKTVATDIGPHTDIHAMAIDRNGNLVVGTDGGVWRWTAATGEWANLNGDLNITQMNSVAVQPGNTGVILGASQDNGVFRTDGSSLGWDQVATGDGGTIRFVPTQANVAYYTTPSGGSSNLVKSTDGGLTFGAAITSIPGAAFAPFSLDILNPNRVVIGGGSGATVRESLDQGATAFTAIPNVPLTNIRSIGLAAYQGIFLADPFFPGVTDVGANTYVPDTIYIANATQVRVTKNHGVTWSADRAPFLGGTTILQLEVDPSNSNVIYVVTQGVVTAGASRVWKSTDSGQTWINISAGLPVQAETNSVINAWKLVVDARSNDLYLGTDKGAWKLTGQLGNWQQFGVGLPNVQVTDIDLNPSSATLTVATYGRGVWQFYLDDNALPNASVSPGAFRSIAGNNTWTGPITLAGPTTISANGSQALQNGLSAATLTLLGTISDAIPTNTYTLTKVGGGDVILSGANTYAGVTDIQQGNLVIHNADALGSNAVAGVQALSVFATQAPSIQSVSLTNGGTLTDATTYYYEITAIGSQGESIGSLPMSVLTTAPNQAVNLVWSGVAGASGYKVYRSTSPTFSSPALVATLVGSSATSYLDTGAAANVGVPPVLRFNLSFNGVGTSTPVTYTGTAADATAIMNALNGLSTINGTGSVTVVQTNPGIFLITFAGALAGINQPMIIATIVGGFGSVSLTNGGGTVVENGSALVLASGLDYEPVTLNGNGIQPSYSGHNTGALRSLSNSNAFTGNLTLNTNSTIGVDSGSTLNIKSASPIVLTSANHGLANGSVVTVAGVLGNTAANGAWTVTVVDANHFALNNSTGNAPYTSGGTWTLVSNISGATTPTALADIVITSTAHGLATGNLVTISGVLGNTAANGTFTITVIDDDNYSLNATAGLTSGAYTSGGLALRARAISAANNLAPITVTSNGHGLADNDQITIINATGNTAINGNWIVSNTTLNTFRLVGSDGTAAGTYSGGATFTRPAATGTIIAANNPIGITDNGVGFGFDKEGAGTLILSSPDTYGRSTAGVVSTNVNQGILNLQHSLALGVAGSTTLVRDGAQLQLQTPSTGVPVAVANENLILSGSGISGTGAMLNVAGDNSWGSTGATIILTAAPGFAPTTTPEGTVSFGVADANDTLTIGSSIGQPTLGTDAPTTGVLPAGLTKVGPGTLTLANANTYAGTTYVTDGAVRIQNSNALGVDNGNEIQRLTTFDPLGASQFTLTFKGQTTGLLNFGLPASGGALPTPATASVQNALEALSSIGAGNVAVTRQTITLEGTRVTITDVSQSGTTVTMTTPSTAGLATGMTVRIAGFTPAGYNGLFAITVIDATHFSYTTTAGLGQVTALGNATVIETGYAYTITFQGTLAGQSQPLIIPTPTGGLNVGNSRVATGGVSTLVSDGAALEVDGDPLGLSASIAVPASERLMLNGTGNAIATGITAVSQLGTTVTATVASTAGLFTGETVTITGFTPAGYNGTVTITVIDGTRFSYTAPAGLASATTLGSLVSSPGALHNITGANTYGGPVTLQTSSSIGVDPATQLTITGLVKDPAPASVPPSDLTKVGAGTLVFPSANTYTGSTFINGGALNIRHNSALGVNTSAVQNVAVAGTSGSFTLSYNGQATGSLNVGATAAQVKAELDTAIQTQTGNPGNAAYSVSVTQLGNVYTVTFDGAALATKAQPVLTGAGTAGTTVTVTPILLGAESDTVVNNGGALQLQGGIVESSTKTLFLNGAGPFGAGALENVAGNNSIHVNTPVILQSNSTLGSDVSGDTLTVPQSISDQHQVQTISLSSLPNGSAYTLTFNGQATTPLTYNSSPTSGARAANAAAIEAALNNLATVTLAAGTVDVTPPSSGSTYTITFGGRLAGTNWPAIVMTRLSNGATVNASRTMVFGGFGIDKVGPGTVQYTGAAANVYNGLTHVINGVLQLNKPALVDAIVGDLTVGTAGIVEVQTVTVNATAGTFGLTFNGATTVDLPFDVPANGGALPGDSMQNALNALSTIGGVGGSVTVTKNGNVYTITFDSVAGGHTLVGANLPAIVISGSIAVTPSTVIDGGGAGSESQAITVTGTAGTFNLTFNGSTTVNLPYNVPATGGTQPGDSLQNALNALASIGGLTPTPGSVTVSKLGSVYTVVFGGALANTNVPPITTTINPAAVAATVTNGGLFSPAGSAVVQLLASNQINNASDTLVNGDGLFNLNGFTEDFGTTFQVVDGQVTTGAGSLILQGGTALDMRGGTITDTNTTAPGGVALQGNVTATSTATGPATITGSGNVNLAGANRTFTINDGPAGSDFVVNSVITDLTGSSGIIKTGAGRLELGAVNTYTGLTRINGGDVQVDTGASIGNVTLADPDASTAPIASVSGKGNIGTVSMLGGGTVNPGYNGTATPYGILNSTGLTWDANTTFFVDLRNASAPGMPVAGADYDQLAVNGTANLNHALLTGSPGAGIQIGDSFTILTSTVQINAPTAPGVVPANPLDRIIGTTRSAIPQGGSVFLNGQKFSVQYNTNDIVLTRQFAVFATLSLSSSANPSVYGQEVTYTVLAVPETGASLATANPVITFDLDGVYLRSVAVNPTTGIATFVPQAQLGQVWAPGSMHTIKATFTDTNNVFATRVADPTPTPGSAPFDRITQLVDKNTVNVTLQSAPAVNSPNPVYGESFNMIATISPVVAPDVPGALNPTGDVLFRIDGNPEPYVAINPYVSPPASETATLIVAGNRLLAPGMHTITAAYAGTPLAYLGDANYAPSAAATSFNLTIQADQSRVEFVPAAQGPSTLGSAATFTVQVVPNLVGSTGHPVGTINFYDGATTNPPLNASPIAYTISDTTVSFTTQALALGNHTIIAVFTPTNANYTGSQASIPYAVNQAPTNTTISSTYTPAAPVFGQAVTFNMQVLGAPSISPPYSRPTGTITLWDGPENTGINLGTGSVTQSTGMASVTTLAGVLAQGNHPFLTAVYSGDGQYARSSGTLNNVFIAQAPTSTTLAITPANTSAFGTLLTFTATVTSPQGSVPANVTPGTSFVTFVDTTTSTTLGTANVVAGGTATLSNVALPTAGNHSIRATYTNTFNTNFGPSFGDRTYTVTGAPTTVTGITANWSTDPTRPVFQQPVTFTATVTSPGGTVTTGPGSTIRFVDTTTGITLGTGIVQPGGTASITTTNQFPLSAATHTITASYTDTADNFFTGPSTPFSLTNFVVNRAPTVTTLSSSSAPSNISALGTQVTYTATVVTDAPSSGAPVNASGTVTFRDNSVIIGTANVNASGIATVTKTYTVAGDLGNHNIDATYNPPTTGQINYLTSTATTLTQTVQQRAAITATTTPASPVFGQPITLNINVAAVSPSTGTPNGGTVTVMEGVTNLGSAVLVSGSVGINIGLLNPGNHTLTISYTGDTNAFPATFADVTTTKSVTVAVAGTTINFSPAPQTSAVYGGTVSYTGTVTNSSGGANPTTGTVTLFDLTTNTTLSGPTPLGPGNAFDFNSIPLPANINVGTHTIQVIYTSGSPNYQNVTRNSTLTVTQAPTNTALTSDSPVVSGNPQSNYGQTVTFTAVISTTTGGSPTFGPVTYSNSTASGAPTSGVPVNFYLKHPTMTGNSFIAMRGTVTRTATTANSATYVITTAILPAAGATPYQVQAYYVGTANIGATPVPQLTSHPQAVVFQRVVPATTATTLVSSLPGGSSIGQPVTFTATVNVTSGGATGNPSPSGYARFHDMSNAGAFLGFGTLVSTTATSATYSFTTSSLAIGPHNIECRFVTDNPNFAASTSPIVSQPVGQAQTATQLVSSPTFWAFDTQTIFVARVSYAAGYAGSLINGGQVVFQDGASVLGVATVGTHPFAAATYVEFQLAALLTPGPHTITATYSSINPNIQGSVGTQTQTVRRFSQMALSGSVATASIGQTVNYTAVLTSLNNVPIVGAAVTFNINGTIVNRTTDSQGRAFASYVVPTQGDYNVTATFLSDGTFNEATATITTAVPNTPGRVVTS